jgi:tetratricopeptide (TPR) repeat protein
MLATALAQLGDDRGDPTAGRSVTDRAWVRTVDEFFCQFHDVAQMKLAANDFAKAPRRLRVRRALIEQAKDLIADRDTPAHRAAQAGRLLLAYRADLDDSEFVDASRALLGILADLHEENRAIERLGDDALSRLDLRDERDRELQWTFAQAQRQLGNPRRAIELLEELLSAEKDVYGPDASEVLGTRRSIASAMALDGRPQAAVEMLESVLAQQLTTRTESDADVLDTRAELALALSDSDRPLDAIRVTEDILAIQAKTLGSDSADLITTRGRLASALVDSGRAAEALPLWEQVATALAARSGQDSPDALAARSGVARATEHAHGGEQAIGLYTAQLADERRLLGPDDPRVLITRENLARSTDDAGDHATAASLYEDLSGDRPPTTI